MSRKVWTWYVVILFVAPLWAAGTPNRIVKQKIHPSVKKVKPQEAFPSSSKSKNKKRTSNKDTKKISVTEVLGPQTPKTNVLPPSSRVRGTENPPNLLDTQTLSWDNGSPYSAYAWYAPGNGWGLRFIPPQYPSQVVGTWMYIWDASWPTPGGDLIDVWVVSGDGPQGRPGTPLLQLSGVSVTRGDWNYIDLSPYDVWITQGDFYIFYIQHDPYPNCPGLAVDDGYYVPENIMWEYADGSYFPTDLSSYYGVFMIQAVIEYTPHTHDVGTRWIEVPDVVFIGPTIQDNSVTPTSGIVNAGTVTESFVEVLEIVDLSTNNVILFQSMSFTLDPYPAWNYWLDGVVMPGWNHPVPGEYLARVFTVLPTDEYPPNDTLEKTFRVVQLQSFSDFEANDGGFTPVGCWEWGTPTYTYGPPNAYSGVNVWGTVLDDDYPNNATCQLVTPPFVVTGSTPMFSFAQWYDIEAGWDGGNVRMSTDGGATWNLIEPIGGYPASAVVALGDEPGFSGDGSSWHSVLFDLTGLVNPGDVVQFMFNFASDGLFTYAGWYIDDVSIADMELFTPSYDVGIDDALAPDPIEPPNTTVTPMAQFTNYGSDVASFNAHLEITQGATSVYHELVPVSLNPGESQVVTFPDWSTGPSGYSYEVHFWHDFAMDTNPDNDELTYQVDVLSCTTEDFEASNGGFTAWEPNGWEWGTPTSGPGSAHSGSNLWATNLAGDYGVNNADWSLVTPVYSVTSGNPSLSYWHWYDIENGWDGYNVKMSTDGGATWTLIYPEGGYPYDFSAFDEDGFTGSSGGWEQVVFDLTGLVNPGDQVQFRFHFGSDGSVSGYPGAYIDDVQVCGMNLGAPNDVSVVSSSINPGDQIIGGSAISLSATVENSAGGTHNATFRVFMKVFKDGMIIYQSFVDVFDLAPGTQQEVFFSPDWVPTAPGNYSLQVSIQIEDDPIPSNNILTVNFEVYMPTVMENLEYTMGTPATYALNAPYPNPASSQHIRIPFQLPEVTQVRLGIYDATGRVISVLLNDMLPPGYYTYSWVSPSRLSGGVYFIRLETGSYRSVQKMLLVR